MIINKQLKAIIIVIIIIIILVYEDISFNMFLTIDKRDKRKQMYNTNIGKTFYFLFLYLFILTFV